MRILDLAERMIRLSGCQVGIDIPIEITGIRPGEKLNEVLSTPDEEMMGTSHPYINRLVPIRARHDVFEEELEQLEAATVCRDQQKVRSLLFTAGIAPDQLAPDQLGTDQLGTDQLGTEQLGTETVAGVFEWAALEGSESDPDQVPA